MNVNGKIEKESVVISYNYTIKDHLLLLKDNLLTIAYFAIEYIIFFFTMLSIVYISVFNNTSNPITGLAIIIVGVLLIISLLGMIFFYAMNVTVISFFFPNNTLRTFSANNFPIAVFLLIFETIIIAFIFTYASNKKKIELKATDVNKYFIKFLKTNFEKMNIFLLIFFYYLFY